MRFSDRKQAGILLAVQLQEYRNTDNLLVLALPRGGLPVAAEIAKALKCPLDVFLVRKLGAPFNPELAIGAIASGGIEVWNQEILHGTPINPAELDAIKQKELIELERRSKTYRRATPFPDLKGKTIILCDDGIATGATISAAIKALQQQPIKQLILAVPVAPTDTYLRLQKMVNKIVCLDIADDFYAIGHFYRDFPQLTDAEVIEILAEFSS